MPANLTPEYFEVERKLKTAKTPQEKISIYEELLSVIPKHKGTEKLQALFKTKIAKLKDEMRRRPSTARHGSTSHIEKSGSGQIIVIGPPNAGKSALIKTLTGAEVEVADYPYTTRIPAPFMMAYKNIQIQLIDTPPITAEYMETWLPEIIKASDAVLLITDLINSDSASALEGILLKLKERKVELVSKAADITPEKFPFFKRTLLVANKNDSSHAELNLEEFKILFSGQFDVVSVSALTGDGIENFRKEIFSLLNIVRVYSKVPGKKAEYEAPFTLKKGSTVLDMARAVHKDFAQKLNYARIWGKGGFEGQRVTRDHILEDEDVVELHI
jgi:hypothetical protein